MSAPGSLGSFDDWRPGRAVDRCCLKKVLCAAGLTSYSGDAEQRFAPVRRWLQERAGFDPSDFLEATYAGSPASGEAGRRWWPRPYHLEDAMASIATSVEALSRELAWYRERLPATRFYLLGYSLGGVIAFEAAGRLLSRDLAGWRGRLAGIALLASPLLGADFGILSGLARSLADRPNFYGAAGRELVERARDAETAGQMESTAALLRASGVRLLTIVSEYDAVVEPRDAVLPSARAAGEVVALRPAVPPDADDVARRFGHGPVLADPTCLRAIGALVGEQECLAGLHRAPTHRRTPAEERAEAELAALKEQWRRQTKG